MLCIYPLGCAPIVPLEIGFFCHSSNGKVRENKIPTSFLSTSWFWYYDSNFSWSTVIYVMLPFHGSYFSYHTLIIVAWPWLLWRKFQGFISNQCSTLSLPFLSLAVYSQFSWHVIATSIASQMPDGLVYSWVKTCRSKGESVQITRNERCNWVTLWGGLNHWFGSYGPSFFMQVKSPKFT